MTATSFAASTDADTRDLLRDAANALVRQIADEMRVNDRTTHRDSITADLRAVADRLAHGGPEFQAAQHRAICNLLHLFRACPRAACFRSRSCRGRAAVCLAHADVPDAVFDHAVGLMLARLVPAAATLLGRRTDGQFAYAAWIAAMEARR